MSLLAFLGSTAGSTIVGAGSSLLSNIFGASLQNKTNDTNLRINRMNNEFNERMMQKQMDYNTMMWNKQNAYNSPTAQLERLKAAGVNPYVASGGVSAGTAQSAGSTSAASAAGAAPQQAYKFDFSGIPQSILMARQGELLKSKAQEQIIDNQTRAMRNMQEIANLIADTKNKDIQHKLSTVQYSYADQLHQLQVQNQELTNANLKEQTDNLIREGLLKQKELDIFDERIKLEFAQRAADILNTKSNTAYTKQLQVHEIQKLYETCARIQGIKISNDTAKRMADSLVRKAHKDSMPSNFVEGVYRTFTGGYRAQGLYE